MEQAENGLKDQKAVVAKLEKDNVERKAELASINKDNLGISYQIEDAEEKVRSLKQQLLEKKAEKKNHQTRNESSLQFTKASINGSKDTIKSNLNSARKVAAPIKQSVKDRIKFKGGTSGVVNHPDIDPNLLTLEQGLLIQDYITQIKTLEKEYTTFQAMQKKEKAQQFQAQRAKKEQAELF